jgi:uncharacterized protein YggE
MSAAMMKKVLAVNAFLIILTSALYSSECPMQPETPCILVNGDAKLSVPADRVQITLTVVSTSENPQDAVEANKPKMNTLISALEKLGLEQKEYKTSTYNLSPNWAPQPKNPKPDWKPQIISYTMTNSLEVKTTKLDLVGKIIQTALSSGANQIDKIYFDVSDEQKYNSESIQKAVQNALSDARAAAEASGVKLGKILTINVNNAYMTGNDYGRGVFAAKSMMYDNSEAAPAPNIAAGDVTLSASVSIKVEIEQ